MVQLPGPDLQGQSGTGETGVEAKRLGESVRGNSRAASWGMDGTNSNTATALINQELQIQQGATSPGEAGQHCLPPRLLLVCPRMSEYEHCQRVKSWDIQQWAN